MIFFFFVTKKKKWNFFWLTPPCLFRFICFQKKTKWTFFFGRTHSPQMKHVSFYFNFFILHLPLMTEFVFFLGCRLRPVKRLLAEWKSLVGRKAQNQGKIGSRKLETVYSAFARNQYCPIVAWCKIGSSSTLTHLQTSNVFPPANRNWSRQITKWINWITQPGSSRQKRQPTRSLWQTSQTKRLGVNQLWPDYQFQHFCPSKTFHPRNMHCD